MKIFMAIDFADIVPLFYEKTRIKLNYLISYAYLQGQAVKLTKIYRKDMIDQLFLDSGAFTSSTGKTIITVSEYLKYLKRYGRYFDAVFNLDEEFTNPEKNFVNQVYLEEGLKGTGILPVPVVHDPENPFDEFKRYADQGHTFIAIGSSPKVSDENLTKMKENYPDVKLHMFGNLTRNMLRKHKPYSADSREAGKVSGLGSIIYWDPKGEKEHKVYIGGREKEEPDYVHYNEFELKKNLDEFLLKTFAYDYETLLWSEEARNVVNLYYFKQLENAINQSTNLERVLPVHSNLQE